ncbi:MAG: TetR family transcriptional regulator [Clostridia bacterium]|nr:TetR family transcriptional regulator [Clostridia bacterium]
MAAFTKKAIVESFLHLLGKKPIDKITVRDVVDHCGINRNTFYYYFQDIYAVLEEISRNVADALPQEASLPVTFEAFFRGMWSFNAAHPRTTRGLLLSLGLDGLERYFARDMDGVISACLAREVEKDEWDAPHLKRVTAFLRHAIFGFCIDFLNLDKSESFEEALADIVQILQDTQDSLCNKNRQKQKNV